MKKLTILIVALLPLVAYAQDFNKDLASARTAYSGGKLEDARFAMQQMLNDIDVLVGKEIIKILPAKMDALASNPKEDQVTANTGIAGAQVQRTYGTGTKNATVDIMSNSPLIGSVNAILSIPFVGNSSDGTQKVVKVQGYKGILQKSTDTETNKENFTLQVPLNSALLTFTVNESNEADVLRLANTIPVTQIAKMVQ
ncbi:hypothetical protein KK062_16335 [Fulvivirgaceae bacterium PWU5]|uniref:DUF4251 domain-containing protein n=1 Tax=Dawidia cretensis TaxID=2782350 RepID=A0AAP2GQZ8_9BACT|nr:hypothetical protein [Dawidia cretensis]MBT1709814.1 hypothetical protein [Dawidia cretensis]